MRKQHGSGLGRWTTTIGAFFFIVLIVISLSIYRLYTMSSWDGVTRFTVLDWKDSAFLFRSFDPVTGEGISLSIPNDLEISTLQGRGMWRVGVLPDLAHRFGWTWAADSLADSLGLAYVGFLPELGIWDTLMWKWKTHQVSFRTVNLSDTSLVEKNAAVDGAKILGLSTVWDDKAREWFVSAGLVAEGQTIRIVNTLAQAGMGTHAARRIEHSGLRVGSIDSDESRVVDRCEVRAGKSNRTTSFLVRSFGCDYVEIPQRDGVELILGREYRSRWLGV